MVLEFKRIEEGILLIEFLYNVFFYLFLFFLFKIIMCKDIFSYKKDIRFRSIE